MLRQLGDETVLSIMAVWTLNLKIIQIPHQVRYVDGIGWKNLGFWEKFFVGF